MNAILAHWKIRGAVLALTASFGTGAIWQAHRHQPQPAVALKQDTALQKDETKDASKRDSKAPVTVDRKTYRTDCPAGSPPVLASETVTRRGPEVIETRTQSQTEEQVQQHTDLTISPAPSPRWALGAGVEDPLGARKLNLSLGMRVIGPVWLRAGITPTRGVPGATIGAEVQW